VCSSSSPYMSLYVCVYTTSEKPPKSNKQKKTKTKTKPKKINWDKNSRRNQTWKQTRPADTTDQSYRKLLEEVEVLGPRLRFEHLQFCKASRRCDDRTRSGSCRACVRGRSALGTQSTNVGGVRRTIEGLAVVRWRPLKTKP
jgi:hypothetical protein